MTISWVQRAIARDVLAQRAALIAREPVVERRAREAVNAVLSRWRSTLTREVARATESARSEASRRASILQAFNRMTEAQVRAAGSVVEPVYRATYARETVRYTEIVRRIGGSRGMRSLPARVRVTPGVGRTIGVESSLGVRFSGISMRQVIASESIRTVPGLDIADIGRRIMDRAHRLVTDALASGESTDRLAQRLVDLGATTASRASAVARTALMSASNNAAVVTFRESESVAGLRWVATFDERTCPLCGALHGSEYKADDPALPPMPAHFNCRCVWLPVFVDAGLNDAVEAEFTQAVGELEAGAPLRSSGAFDSWLRSADATVRADFFPSVLKRAAFESGHFGVRDLIASDGDVVTDEQLMRTLRRMGIDRKVQRAAESILSGLSK